MAARVLQEDTVVQQVSRFIDGLVVAAGHLARLCALAMVVLVTGNVLARYFFSAGNVGLQELEWHLISPIALLGMSYALHQGEHVRVDVFYERMPAVVRTGVDIATALLTMAVGGYLAWLAVPYVESSYALGQGSPDPGGLPHRFLLKAFIPIGFGLLALQALGFLLRSLGQRR